MTNKPRLTKKYVFIFVLSIALWGAVSACINQHEVLILGKSYDAGDVKAGGKVHHSYRLINLSAQSVEVGTEPLCGCTQVSTKMFNLKPFNSRMVPVDVDIEGGKGVNRKTIVFHFQTGDTTWWTNAFVQFEIKK